MSQNKSVRVSFIGARDVLQHIVRVKESKYGTIVYDFWCSVTVKAIQILLSHIAASDAVFALNLTLMSRIIS